jgi:hypothetical protein
MLELPCTSVVSQIMAKEGDLFVFSIQSNELHNTATAAAALHKTDVSAACN